LRPGETPPTGESARHRRTRSAGLLVLAVVVAIAVAIGVLAAARAQREEPDEEVLPPVIEDVPLPTTTTVVPTIEVETEFGAAIIARSIRCEREEPLDDTSVAGVRAAVAADNVSGPKPFAYDRVAQNEIVQATLAKLHDEKRFYADCAPIATIAATTGESSALPDDVETPPGTLPGTG
jgi:hypothetical protein